jgi:predicted lipoprotein with Yx(FWY)xxD motif
MVRRVLGALGVAVLALGLVACGDDDDDPATVGAEGADQVDEETEDGATDGEAGEDGTATVAVGDTSLGEVLVDAEGMTLYLFTPDSPEASTCTGQCAEVWPPLEATDEPVAGDGVDQALLGVIERDDGTAQVTYAGHPLYTYAPDEEPGDADGQGLNDVWYVVAPDGEAVTAAAAAATTAPGPAY